MSDTPIVIASSSSSTTADDDNQSTPHPIDALNGHDDVPRSDKKKLWDAIAKEVQAASARMEEERLLGITNDEDDDDDDDGEVDTTTVLDETKFTYVDEKGEKDVDAAKAINSVKIHFKKEGKLLQMTMVGVAPIKPQQGVPPVAIPSTDAAQADSATTAESTKDDAEEALMMKKLNALRTTALTKAYAKAVGALGIVLQDLVDNPGKPLFKADREVSNKILEARVARKTRTVDVSKEPLLMTRMTSLEPAKDAKKGAPLKWGDIQILDLRNPKVAANYSADFVKKYDDLEPNNSAIRLLILETPLKTKELRAHIRMWVFFSVKEKQDKQTVKFLEKRAGTKKAKNGVKAQAGISPVVAPLRVERGPGSFDAPDSIVVLATFLECPPVLKSASKRFDEILGVEKAKLIDLEMQRQMAEQLRAASEDAKKAEETAKQQESQPQPQQQEKQVDDDAPPPELVDANATTVPVVMATSSMASVPAPKKDDVELLVARYFHDGIKPSAEKQVSPPTPAAPEGTTPAAGDNDAAKKQKEEDEAKIKAMVDEVRKELKEMASTYKAQTMALELVGIDYQRRRMEARESIIVPRIDNGVIQFLFFTYAEHLMLRVLDARPNIAEPLAIVTVLENNGTIVNMDESTCITLSQLETLIKAESSDSPTMTMYRGLHAAFNSAKFDPRRHVLMYFLERGKFQDLGQNVRKIIITQANYAELETAANYKIKSSARQPGAPTSVAELLDSIRRANALNAQLDKAEAQRPAPAT